MTQRFQHPPQWRETADPFALPFGDFTLLEVLGYPHAGNDVFHVLGAYQGKETAAYIKIARHKDANIVNEVTLLRQLSHPALPRVLDAGTDPQPFSVTQAMPGLRLSVILGEHTDCASLGYMESYGEALAWIHQQKPQTFSVRDRRFFHSPTNDMLDALDLSRLKGYFSGPPEETAVCFCHGDFHYANLLWEDHRVSAMLDFELAGMGDRDFDIAWALIRRPGQRFLTTEEERRLFLSGYRRSGVCSEANVLYFTAQIYVYWLQSCQDDETYSAYIRQWLDRHIP